MKIDPLGAVAWKWTNSRTAPRYAAYVLVIISVFTAIQQSISGLVLLRQLPTSARALACFTFGVTVFFNALSPVIVLIAFSALLWAAAYVFRASCDLRRITVLGGISHLPIALWSAVAAVVIAAWPPELDLQEVLSNRAALELTWQFNLIASLRLVAYLWSILLFTILWSRTTSNETWRKIAAVAVATTSCLAVLYGASSLSG
ncbi:MAG: hypothetical protein ABI134_33065 [Byssovorax sp.]